MHDRSFLDALQAIVGEKGYSVAESELEPWLTDWRGRYKGRALMLVSPRDTRQVSDIVRLCASRGVPIVPQGGNTSMVGGATPDPDGRALILSLRRMNKVRSIDPPAGLAIAEAGVILSDLHDLAAQEGMRFPLSLGAKGSATIGGLCSTNAGGTQVLRFGTMRALVLGLEAVLADGSILSSLVPLKKDNRGPDLKQLLIGAEGTLGIITAATLKLVPVPDAIATAWAGVASPYEALALLRRLEASGLAIESFELLPSESLQAVLRHIPETRAPLERNAPWHVLVEATGGPDVRQRLVDELGAALEGRTITDAVLAESGQQSAAFWRIRESISEAERASGPAVQHDVSVPVEAMPAFMVDAAHTVEARFPGTHASGFGHLGDGNVHFHVRAPAGSDRAAWMSEHAPAISAFVHDLVVAAGGSISAEHGIGQMKRDELARLGDPAHLSALRALKAAFDPLGIMNPGKLIPAALASSPPAP